MPTTRSEEHEHQPLALAELIRVRQRFLRSVSLERDFYRADPLDGYILTPSAATALERVTAGIEQASARAFTITGPYGSGKSALALFAAKALAGSGERTHSIRERARDHAPNIADRLFDHDTAGLWPVLISGRREPLARALVHGLEESLDKLPHIPRVEVRKALQKACPGTLRSDNPSPRDVAELFAEASAIACRLGESCRGILLVVDELGKFLEYAAIHPTQSDIHVLQELAEAAARSTDAPLFVVTILHQAFEDYANRLSAVQRNEWQKVQGRFIDIPFGDGPEVTFRLVAEAIEQKDLARYFAVRI